MYLYNLMKMWYDQYFLVEAQINSSYNHKNYNFLDCDWFKKRLFSTDSLAKLLSDSLLSDSSISQSHSKL